jgi:L-ascorbate metabolism protein UlaG (beta-lactamase superfamily)
MLENIEVLYHSSIRINKDKIIYIDPFKIDKNYNDADIVFITHDHYDHYSEEDIDKVINKNTTIIIPEELLTKLLRKGINKNAIITVEPNVKYMVQGIKFETIPAYNTNKSFHPKENDWVGYIITLNDIRYYVAGDTDITEENRKVKCDVAFVPVGGTYTMDFKEAAQLINEIQPKIAVPIHYGSVVGTEQDASDFIKLLHPNINGMILMKNK